MLRWFALRFVLFIFLLHLVCDTLIMFCIMSIIIVLQFFMVNFWQPQLPIFTVNQYIFHTKIPPFGFIHMKKY